MAELQKYYAANLVFLYKCGTGKSSSFPTGCELYPAAEVDSALAAKDAELQTALHTIEALVAAGFVTQAKVDQARALFSQVQPSPHPDTARLDKLPACFHMLRTLPGDGLAGWWLSYAPNKVYSDIRDAIDAHQEPKP